MQRRQGIMEGDEARQKMPKDVVEKVQFEASSKQQQGIGPGTPQKHGAKSKQKCCLLLHWDSLKLEVKVWFYGKIPSIRILMLCKQWNIKALNRHTKSAYMSKMVDPPNIG